MQPWPDQSPARWPIEGLFRSLLDVPKIEADERDYAVRLGALIQRERLAQDVSQEKLAEAAGVSVGTIGRWERGANPPRSYQLAKIVARLGSDPGDFFSPPDVTSDLDRLMAAKVGEGVRAGDRPRRRATRLSGGERASKPAPRPRPGHPGSTRG